MKNEDFYEMFLVMMAASLVMVIISNFLVISLFLSNIQEYKNNYNKPTQTQSQEVFKAHIAQIK